MPFFSTVYIKTYAMLNKDIRQNMHFDVVLSVFIHPWSKKRRRAQCSISAELTRLSVCVHFSVWETFHTAHDCYSNNPESLLCSPHAFGQSLYQSWHLRLNENACVGCNAYTDIMWKCGQCQNKGAFLYYRYWHTTDIDILHVASMYRIVIHCIDISIHIDELLHPIQYTLSAARSTQNALW